MKAPPSYPEVSDSEARISALLQEMTSEEMVCLLINVFRKDIRCKRR